MGGVPEEFGELLLVARLLHPHLTKLHLQTLDPLPPLRTLQCYFLIHHVLNLLKDWCAEVQVLGFNGLYGLENFRWQFSLVVRDIEFKRIQARWLRLSALDCIFTAVLVQFLTVYSTKGEHLAILLLLPGTRTTILGDHPRLLHRTLASKSGGTSLPAGTGDRGEGWIRSQIFGFLFNWRFCNRIARVLKMLD